MSALTVFPASQRTIDEVLATQVTDVYPTFPFGNVQDDDKPKLYFVATVLTGHQLTRIHHLYDDLEEINRLRENYCEHFAPFADGTQPVEMQFREETILDLVEQIKGWPHAWRIVGGATLAALRERYNTDGGLCFFFKEQNHPDQNRYIVKNGESQGQGQLNGDFSTYVVLANSGRQACQFISSL